MTTEEFQGTVVLVTGAAGGIGRAICARFEACGAEVYRTDVAPLEHARFVQGDLTDPAFSRQCLRYVLDNGSRLDVLVNSAGICPRVALPDITLEDWHTVMDTNLTSAFLLSQACMEVMIEQHSGVIVNLCSLAGKVGGIAVGAHYSASKAALECLTKTLARHGAGHGVRANAVAPGIIDTEMTRSATAAQQEALLKTIPQGYIGSPNDVAGPVVFLASSSASYITGATLNVNGGLLME